MTICNYESFLNKTYEKEILSLDISKNRIGIAISVKSIKLALPVKTIVRSKIIKDISSIISVYNNYSCGGIVIGYPVNPNIENNNKNPRCQSIRSFVKLLLDQISVPIFLEDEQFSTYAIKDLNSTNNIKQKKPIDAKAASYFLQNFLNRMHYN